MQAGFHRFGGGDIAPQTGEDTVKGNGGSGMIVAKYVVIAETNAFQLG
jgi:hypothetical protein